MGSFEGEADYGNSMGDLQSNMIHSVPVLA